MSLLDHILLIWLLYALYLRTRRLFFRTMYHFTGLLILLTRLAAWLTRVIFGSFSALLDIAAWLTRRLFRALESLRTASTRPA